MPLREFIEEGATRDLTLAVENRTEPLVMLDLVRRTLENEDLPVVEATSEERPADTVALYEEDAVVATSPLSALRRAILLVNSDLYRTGTRRLENVSLPDVLRELWGTQFRVRGYPRSEKEKLLLITISRYIERLAHQSERGTLRVGFQSLSRLADESGTRAVYSKLAETDLDIHAYCRPPARDPPLDVTLHTGKSADYSRSWFVVFVPADSTTAPAALVAHEVAQNAWDGIWTLDGGLVRDIDAYVASSM